jgi:hypothetical protein
MEGGAVAVLLNMRLASVRSVLGTGLSAALIGLVTTSATAAPTATGEQIVGNPSWSDDRVVVSVDSSFSKLGAGADEALRAAVDTWQIALPGWPILELDYSWQTDRDHDERCHTRDGYDPQLGSENRNVVRFAEYGEPTANGALAITVLTYDAEGTILDADITVNGVYSFGDAAEPTCTRTTDDAHSFPGFGGPIDPSCQWGCHGEFHLYDLQSILTHEFGHLLGLREDYDNEQATMYAYSWPGEVHKRDLDDSDIDALWAIYDAEAQADGSASGCSGASVAGESSTPQAWVLLGIALGFIAGRRRPGGTSTRSEDGSIVNMQTDREASQEMS